MADAISSRETAGGRANSGLHVCRHWPAALLLLLGLFAAPRVDAACSPAAAGIVGWWPGDGTANDISGTNNGALQGGATASAAGLVSSAFTFDGTNGYVQIPDAPALRPTNLTVEAWVRFSSLESAGTAAAGQQYIVFKQNTRTSGFEGYNLAKLRIAGGDVLAFIVSSASGQLAELHSATLVSAGVWYHVAGVRGSNFTQLYVNGQLESQTSVSFAQDYGSYPLLFGTSGQTYWDRKLKGSLDEVSLYNRALSSNEVSAIYIAGAAGKCKTGTIPSITTPPQSQSVVAESNALFTLVAAGAAPLSYQWRFNGVERLGATNTSLTLTGVQPADAGSYAAVVTNSVGSVTSAVAVLTVLVPPGISVQPQSLTNVAGTTAAFSVIETGSTPLSYRWQLNGLSLTNGGRVSGATTNALAITSAQTADAGSYTLVLSNSAGAVTSAVAVLTVLVPPGISAQPQSLTKAAGTTAGFSVTATGTTPLTYQWQLNGGSLADDGRISGSATNALTIANAQPPDAGSYTVVLSNAVGVLTSAVAVLTVVVPPGISVQPQSLTNVAGTMVGFSVTETGSTPLSYRWQLNGLSLTNGGRVSGATTNALAIASAQAADVGSYTLVLSNTVGAVTSAVAVLTVLVPPGISAQPASQNVVPGSSVTLAATVSGTPPLTYQWSKNGANLVDGGNRSGATATALTLASVQTNDAGAYVLTVTNSAGAVTSSVANLTLLSLSQSGFQNAGAVVLVNSSSARFLDFQHYLQPYLDNFGVPYTVLDIATNGVGTNLEQFALIVIGHSQLDTNGTSLTSAGQDNISLAVSHGTGLVSFDGALSGAGGNARYPFVQSIFGFGYGASSVASSVTLPMTEPQSQMHYITSRHSAGESITLRASMTLPGVTLRSNATAVATGGAQPLLVVTKYGQGCAAQWTSYDWMNTSVLGPVDGLDDLVWRSLVWAARKPFVMRGLPNFLTLRMDDAAGPFWWVHIANEMGFKPWLGIFLSYFSETNTADLRSLVTNGLATASIHSLDCCTTFFYYNHGASAPWSDNVMSNYFYTGTQWHASRGIPISKVVVAHYSEIGPNAYAGLKDWGVEYMGICFPPGGAWLANPPWLMAGPYKLYETPRSGASMAYPMVYADFYPVPGHPEFDGQFFNCVTEIRDDVACGEWCPSNSDVAGSIGRGTRQVKRAFDSLVHATLYCHEWFLIPIPQSSNQTPITTNNWRAILQGITNNLAGYNPIFVTYDYAAQYSRATRTSRLATGNYDPVSGRVTATLSGSSDLDMQVSVYMGQDNAISASPAMVPAFSGTSTSLAAMLLPPRLAVRLTPTNTVVLSWPNPTPGFVLQENAALGKTNWATVTNQPVVVGDALQVILENPAGGRFYRLFQS